MEAYGLADDPLDLESTFVHKFLCFSTSDHTKL